MTDWDISDTCKPKNAYTILYSLIVKSALDKTVIFERSTFAHYVYPLISETRIREI